MIKKIIIRLLYALVLLSLILSTIILSFFGYIGNSIQYKSRFSVNFDEPTTMVQAPHDNSVIYVAEKAGRILKLNNIQNNKDYEVFLDLSSVVVVGFEDGLLGMAFHPDYPQVPKFYVFYSRQSNQCQDFCVETVLSQFQVVNGLVNRSSEQVLLTNFEPNPFHRSGTITFGPEGYLYVNIGDGTMQWQAQNLTNFYGSILRLDVNHPQNTSVPYGIPSDNPFVNTPGARPEIYAYGLRNPFRGDFDHQTGNYWVGDVGNDLIEEVDHIQPGNNYGYPYYEGVHCRFNCSQNLKFDDPFTYYYHPTSEIQGVRYQLQDKNIPSGIAIVGTTIYRGTELKSLVGKLVIADYLGALYSVDTTTKATRFVTRLPTIISQVYQDSKTNELYVVAIGIGSNNGKIYQLVKRLPVFLIALLILITAMIALPIYFKYRRLKTSHL